MPENPSDLPPGGPEELAAANGPAQAAPLTPPTGSPMPTPPRLKDRLFRFRSVVAVAAAGVIVGGAAGAGITAISDGHGDGRPQFGRSGFGPGHGPGMSGGRPPGMPGGQGFQGGQNGQGFRGGPGGGG
jgi:translation initiation factor IF-2